ncbi:MAG: hypothetical protein ACKO8X_01385, partial [Verrucomicrobiota bacterium]
LAALGQKVFPMGAHRLQQVEGAGHVAVDEGGRALDRAVPHEALYWRFGEQMAIRQGDWKLVRYDTNADTNAGRGKKQPTSAAKLYNLAADIHEDKDLSAEMPAKVKELQARWDEWNQANVKPLWGSGAGDNDGPEPGVTKKGKKKAAK